VRVTSAFNRLLALSGVSVTEVSFGQDTVTVDVALRRRRWQCPECAFSTRARYDIRPGFSCWRGLDLGRWKIIVRASLRWLVCPSHGVRVEAVPFARHRSGFSRDFEDLVAFLATKTDKTTITDAVPGGAGQRRAIGVKGSGEISAGPDHASAGPDAGRSRTPSRCASAIASNGA